MYARCAEAPARSAHGGTWRVGQGVGPPGADARRSHADEQAHADEQSHADTHTARRIQLRRCTRRCGVWGGYKQGETRGRGREVVVCEWVWVCRHARRGRGAPNAGPGAGQRAGAHVLGAGALVVGSGGRRGKGERGGWGEGAAERAAVGTNSVTGTAASCQVPSHRCGHAARCVRRTEARNHPPRTENKLTTGRSSSSV